MTDIEEAVKLARAIVDGGHVIPLERIAEVARALLSLKAENERLGIEVGELTARVAFLVLMPPRRTSEGGGNG